jgi:hypothetical protein
MQTLQNIATYIKTNRNELTHKATQAHAQRVNQ